MLRRLLPGTATLAYDELAYRQFGMEQRRGAPRPKSTDAIGEQSWRR